MSNWTSMATPPPEDETYYLVVIGGVVMEAYWQSGEMIPTDRWLQPLTDAPVHEQRGPSHWLPLPNPPFHEIPT